MNLEETMGADLGTEREGQVAQSEAASGEPVVDPRDEMIGVLRAQVGELQQQALRTLAEAQTVQRRMRAQAESDLKMAVQPLVERLLPILDNLSRAQEMLSGGASVDSVVAGLSGLERQLQVALEANGVQRIESVGQPFDPEVHEAVSVVGEEGGREHVAEELSAGYRLHDRVIRAAKVKVSRGE
ncbi:MAG: nucleotide exchange factor GrpE [Fimbriimonadaceae bacterium]